MKNKYITELVVARLKTIPPNVGFSIGDFGDFTRNELIQQVQDGTPVGKVAIQMEIRYLQEMPKIAKRVQGHG